MFPAVTVFLVIVQITLSKLLTEFLDEFLQAIGVEFKPCLLLEPACPEEGVCWHSLRQVHP